MADNRTLVRVIPSALTTLVEQTNRTHPISHHGRAVWMRQYCVDPLAIGPTGEAVALSHLRP